MDMVMKTVPQRLSKLLLRLADQYGRDEDGGTVIDLTLSRQEIADMIGVSRETATRELSKFSRSGTIELEGKKIRLVDRPKLELWAKV
jgi:CRP/FNR family transcriptional regulator